MSRSHLSSRSRLSPKPRGKQKGTFSIEFAIIGVFFSLLIAFSGDVIIKLSVKGKLDRLSYSLVNILKERTQFYSSDPDFTADGKVLNKISKQSLQRTMPTFENSNYGLLIESLAFYDPDDNSTYASPYYQSLERGGNHCSVSDSLEDLESLAILSSWDRKVPLYRVTLCYETDNWIGDLLGTQFSTVSSSSFMIGR
ncbi:hypothetical protein BCU68_01310 [Vibrio sp. 10N.286.49.B3]|uniref:tight adherence pilus pseudopilin TadF n=1 Tax=Vibrio sp. 10N.286.49.B3 TaxID=1880855 RepID=UPI000CAE01F5|nr:tight adherence pilus pseudopilin TadF [Vibrio sp. 10N.286.49.B3]PMH46900.1 hypothetical protein BCU68_01310 [Vibrio sp. 10N.286.49.B3]